MESFSKSGLTKIILINSFIKEGLIHEFDIERNVHITGTNGAGKTTFLRLLPMFYGMNAGDIVQKSDSTMSFSQWYLPNPASYIVFEYITTHHKRVQAVFFASTDGQKTRCRFLNKGFEETDFLFEEDGFKGAFTASDIAKHWHANDIEFTSILSRNNHYRKVIQGIPNKEISGELYRYSIASSRTPLNRIDKIIHGILNSEMKMENMKSLLMQVVGKMNQFDTSVDVVVDSEGVDKWVREQRVVSRLNAHKGEFNKAIENHDAITLDESNLITLLGKLKFKEPILNESLDSKNIELKDKIAVKKRLREEYEEAEAGFKEDIRSTKHRASLKEEDITRIEGVYNKFDEDGIDQQIMEYKLLPEVKETLSKLSDQYDSLIGESKDIELTFDKLISELQSGKMQLCRTAEKDLSVAKELKHHLRNKEKDRYDVQREAEEKYFRLQEKMLENERTTHSTNVAVTKSKLESVTAPTELLDREATANKQVMENLKNIGTQNQNIYIAEKNATQAKTKLDNLLNTIGSNETKKNELSQLRSKLVREFDPKCGTLLSFLEDKLPEWQSSPIGCLINPSVLSRTDLTPVFDNKGIEKSFFGLNIDLSKLPASEQSTDALREKLAVVTEQEIDLIEKIALDTEAAEHLLKEKTNAEQELDNQKRDLTRLNTNKEVLEQQADSATMDVENAITNLTALLNKDLDAHNKALSGTITVLKDLSNKCNEHLEIIRNDHLENLGDIETTQDGIIDAFEVKIKNIKEDEKEEVKVLRANKKAALTSKGISPDVIDEMELKIQEHKKKIDTLLRYEATIRHYEEFMQSDYLRLPQLRSEKSKLVAQANAFEIGCANATREYTQQVNKLSTSMDKINERLELLNDQEAKLEAIFNVQEKRLLSAEETQNESLIKDLFIEYDHLASQLASKMKVRTKSIKEIEHLLNKDGANEIYAFWHKSVQSKGFDVTDADKMAVFKDLAIDILPQTERTLIAHIHTICEPIVSFTAKLEDFRAEIKRSSKQISSAVKENLVEFDAIERIDIQMVSKIDRVQGWEDLKRLCKRYEEWELNEDDKFPNDRFIKSLQAVADHIDRGHIKENFVDLFDLSFSVTENGNDKIAQTEKSFKNLSSNGLLTLLTCILYSTLITMQRQGQTVQIHYPIDELGTLATDNAVKLLEMLNTNNITMIAALPEAKGEILKNFDSLYHIDEIHGKVDGYITPSLLDQAVLEAELAHNESLIEDEKNV